MEQTDLDPRAEYCQSLLDEARDALQDNNLDEAQRFFEQALGVEGKYPWRVTQIREMLKKYCDRVSDQDSPTWDDVHQALNLLVRLDLVDEQSKAWQQEFKLKEAEFWLAQENLDKSFDIFAELMDSAQGSETQSRHSIEISNLVRVHIAQRLSEQRWLLLGEVVNRLQSVRPHDELRDWLETTSNILSSAAKQGQQLRRYRSLTYALAVGIAAVLVVAFALVLLVP
jgi:hypothetical protein